MFATVFYFDILIAAIVLFFQSSPYHWMPRVSSCENPFTLLEIAFKRYYRRGRMTFR